MLMRLVRWISFNSWENETSSFYVTILFWVQSNCWIRYANFCAISRVVMRRLVSVNCFILSSLVVMLGPVCGAPSPCIFTKLLLVMTLSFFYEDSRSSGLWKVQINVSHHHYIEIYSSRHLLEKKITPIIDNPALQRNVGACAPMI